MPVRDHAERLRLAALHAYQVLDQESPGDLDGLVALAAHITQADRAFVHIVDADRVYQAAAVGDARRDFPREGTMCDWVTEHGQALHVPDARQDPTWSAHPLVSGDWAQVGMYAGAPLVTPDGHALGTLCVLHEEPRQLGIEQLGALGLLADQVVALFEGRRQAQQAQLAVSELDRLAHVDPLTGLVNRTSATRALERLCSTGGWGVLFVDVDLFKRINDERGHQTGDVVLREVAGRLRAAVRPHDLVARWAGDEFVVLVAGPVGPDHLDVVVERLHATMREAVDAPGAALEVSLSIGAVCVSAGADLEQVLHDADQDMYADKRRKRATSSQPLLGLGLR